MPVSIAQRRGDPIVVEHDEGVRPGTTAGSLGALRAAFVCAVKVKLSGVVSAGAASVVTVKAAATPPIVSVAVVVVAYALDAVSRIVTVCPLVTVPDEAV